MMGRFGVKAMRGRAARSATNKAAMRVIRGARSTRVGVGPMAPGSVTRGVRRVMPHGMRGRNMLLGTRGTSGRAMRGTAAGVVGTGLGVNAMIGPRGTQSSSGTTGLRPRSSGGRGY